MSTYDDAVGRVREGADPFAEAAVLFEQLTETERLGLLDGDLGFFEGMSTMMGGYNLVPYVHGAVDRLGIPGTRFVDGPRGCVSGHGTAFPVSMARGATWDVALEERVGEAIGAELRSQGGNFFGGVCINLPRHPAWGRIQETYSDEPYQLGEMGAALTRGVQRWAMACAKHYALNSMENKRFEVDVTIDEADLHETYLPHFKRCVDEGVAAIMTAYNSVNGEWCGQNRYLLTDVLRDQWGWDGITVSDFVWGLRDAAASLEAGLDLEEPLAQVRAQHLRRQIDAGEATWDSVRRSGVRLIAAQLRSYATRVEADPDPSVMASDAHRALAQEVAERAMVMLANEPVDGRPVLPLSHDFAGRIVVAGRLADAPNLGDAGSSNVRQPSHVTPLAGIRAAFPGADVVHVEDDDPEAVAEAATAADVVLVVVGFDKYYEGEYVGADTMTNPDLLALFPPLPPELAGEMGEAMSGEGSIMTEGMGGDRASLSLRESDERLIAAAAAANPRTVVVLVGAGTIMMEAWRGTVPAILLMWYAGMEGGHALGRVLAGDVDPSGRLPFAIPADPDDLPPFDRDATAVTYGHLHGQRLIDARGSRAAFPHGWGLSYTTVETESAVVTARDDESVTLDVTLLNHGERSGRHVVQVYGSRADGRHAGERFVVGFAPVEVGAGERVTLPVRCSLSPLATWDAGHRMLIVPAGDVRLFVGAHAHDDAVVVDVTR